MRSGTAHRRPHERGATPVEQAVPLLLGALSSLLFTVFVTWPQARHLATHVAAHADAHFSLWRLGWVAHALRTNPLGLFDTNIFYPTTNTLAYSDATLLEGVLGAPFLWAGLSPIVVYNMLLLGGMAASGCALFVLVRLLTESNLAATVSAAVFTMAPYRIEHIMHLELQWAMWMPLSFWAVHRAIDTTSWRFGVLAGVFLWLQIISCVYYGVFLAIALVALALLLLTVEPRRALRAVPMLAAGGAAGAILTLPYLWPYAEAARTLGGRDPVEVARYSARFASYLASPQDNWLWGWTAARWGGVELSLFPGLTACALAVAAVAARPRRYVVVYAVLAALMIALSFGVHGAAYSWLAQYVPGLDGLRSPSRFGILSCLMISVLAGFGTRVLQQHIASRTRVVAMFVATLSLMCAEYANTGLRLMPDGDPARMPLYRLLRAAPPGVVAELPLPTPSTLPGREADYVFWSTAHWRPLINGYSGYFPVDYLRTLERMRNFPDDQSIATLRGLDVRYVIVHRSYFELSAYTSLMLRVALRDELRPYGRYSSPSGEADLFELEP